MTLQFHTREGAFVFLVHCLVTPDGDLAASGLLDLKVIMKDDNMMFYVP